MARGLGGNTYFVIINTALATTVFIFLKTRPPKSTSDEQSSVKINDCCTYSLYEG
jgi:hypothetical protein